MKRLTTDKPSNNTETMLNYAYAKDGYVHLSYADGEEDIRLTEYLCRVAHEIGCEFATEENILNGDMCLECDCKVSILNVLAIQAAELRERLKKYEDAEEQGLLVRLPCKVGDRMYFLDTCHTAEDFGKKFVSWGEVTKVSIAGMYVCLKTPTGLPLALSWESIFTTREAAEKALEDA